MLLVTFSTLVLAGITAGQPSTNATCSSSFAWADNSLGQSPCLVAAYLGSVCDEGLFRVPALANDMSFYQGPTVAQVNACACSSVFYSLLSACADCQSGQVITWSAFDGNCNTVYPQIFVGNIPSDTAVPHWAYQNVTVERFNSTLAQMQLNAPESTANAQPTGTVLPSGASNNSSKKSNAGGIAGGVVGGVVLLSLVCIAVLWFIRRRRRGVAPSNLVQTPMGYHSTGEITPFSTAPKIYNPSDPSTFPTSSSPAMYSSSRVQSPAYSGNTVTDQPRTQYSGAPEV